MGIVGLTYSLANSLGRYGATANAISPGAATRMTDSVPDERRRTPRQPAPPTRCPPTTSRPWWPTSPRSGRGSSPGRSSTRPGTRSSLYNKPTPLIRLIGNEPWGEEQLAAQIERSFPAALQQGR